MNEIEVFKKKVNELVTPDYEVKVGVINYDLDTFSKNVDDLINEIKQQEICDSNLQDFRELITKLNKFHREINDKKKDIKREYNKPYDAIEKQIKENLAKVDEGLNYAKEKVDIYDRAEHQNKFEIFEKMWEGFGKDKDIPFVRIEKKEWYLKSYNNKKVLLEMSEINDNINKDIELIYGCIENEKERANVLNNYYGSLDAAKEIGEYTKWKNIVENEVKVVEKPVEVITPKEEEKPIETKISTNNGILQDVTLSFTAPSNVTDEIEKILKQNGIKDYFILRQ